MRSERSGVSAEMAAPQTSVQEPRSSELDPLLQRVMQFVEENISNSEAGVGDMAFGSCRQSERFTEKTETGHGHYTTGFAA